MIIDDAEAPSFSVSFVCVNSEQRSRSSRHAARAERLRPARGTAPRVSGSSRSVLPQVMIGGGERSKHIRDCHQGRWQRCAVLCHVREL